MLMNMHHRRVYTYKTTKTLNITRYQTRKSHIPFRKYSYVCIHSFSETTHMISYSKKFRKYIRKKVRNIYHIMTDILLNYRNMYFSFFSSGVWTIQTFLERIFPPSTYRIVFLQKSACLVFSPFVGFLEIWMAMIWIVWE